MIKLLSIFMLCSGNFFPFHYCNVHLILAIIYQNDKTNYLLFVSEEAIPSTEDAYSEAQAHVSYNLPVSVILRRQLNVIDSFENEHPHYKDCIKIGIKLVFTDYTFKRLVICIIMVLMSNTFLYLISRGF